jgi:hypothetical protein
MAQHQLGMITGRLRLDHRGFARRVQSRQQDGRFHLGRGHRQLVGDRQGIPGASDGQRQAAAFPAHKFRPHLSERRGHAGHGPAPQRPVAGHHGGQRMAGQKTQQQPGAGPRIAQVQDIGRFRQAADAAALHQPGPIGATLGMGAKGAHGVGRHQDILALQQTVDLGAADSKAAEHKGAVGNRLIAGHAAGSGQGFRRGRDEGVGGQDRITPKERVGRIGMGGRRGCLAQVKTPCTRRNGSQMTPVRNGSRPCKIF